MVKKLNPIVVAQKLREHNLIIFSPRELQRLFSVSNFAVSKFLHQYTKKNFFVKLRNGLYCLSDNQPNSFVLANKIYVPSYLSLETALSFYSIIPEAVYSITSVTTKKTATFLVGEKQFIYHKIKISSFNGYVSVKISSDIVYLASPEKAVADFCYFVFLGKKEWNDRLTLRGISEKKIVNYLKILGKNRLVSFWDKLSKGYD